MGRVRALLPEDERLFAGLERGSEEVMRVPTTVLFPEVEFFLRPLVVQSSAFEVFRFPDATLFPEAAAEKVWVETSVVQSDAVVVDDGVELLRPSLFRGSFSPSSMSFKSRSESVWVLSIFFSSAWGLPVDSGLCYVVL